MTGDFRGLAYWTLATGAVDWAVRASQVLAPVEQAGFGTIEVERFADHERLALCIDEDAHQMVLAGGAAQGVVRPGTCAGCFVVCLLALRKHLGELVIVDDNQASVPARPRASSALFAADWARVHALAQALALVPDARFKERHGALLQRVF
jgi:hypothetical protein